MDDILCDSDSEQELLQVYNCLEKSLTQAGLKTALEKIQKTTPISYLGHVVDRITIKPQKVQIKKR